RVREAFQVELPLRVFFEAPTIAGLAQAINRFRGDGGIVAPPIEPASRERALPLSFAQQRLWFIDQLEPGKVAYNIPTAVRLQGRLNVEALERTINEIVRRHEVLRTTFALVDSQPVQVINPALGQQLAVIDISALEPDERQAEARSLTAQEAQKPFDLVL